MKNLSGTVRYVLAAVALLPIVGCKEIGVNQTEEKCAEVRPGSEASKKGCDQINQILAKYDKSLYRFQTFKKGKLVGEKGTLNPAYMPEGRIEQVAAEAKEHRLTGCAIQAGPCPLHGTTSTSPTLIQNLTDLPKLEEVLKKNQ